MAGYLIYETKYKYQIEAVIKIIDALAVEYWKSQGYKIDGNGNLIGKKSGIDNPKAQKTMQWDIPTKSPDGTWYCASLNNDDRFKAGHEPLKQQCDAQGIEFKEIERPPEWQQILESEIT